MLYTPIALKFFAETGKQYKSFMQVDTVEMSKQVEGLVRRLRADIEALILVKGPEALTAEEKQGIERTALATIGGFLAAQVFSEVAIEITPENANAIANILVEGKVPGATVIEA